MKVMSFYVRSALLLMILTSGKPLFAQSTVTTSGGNNGTVPVFTGSSMIGISPLTANTASGFVGIGSSSPGFTLDVAGDINFTGAFRYQGLALLQIMPTAYNYFFGNSGNTTMTGCCNTGFGPIALAQNTSGAGSVAIGPSALHSNTSGNQNTAIGWNALESNTTAPYNTAVGALALQSNMTGQGNTAVGQSALISNTTGSGNTAFGQNTLYVADVGVYNTAIGYVSLSSLLTGYSNTVLGSNALTGLLTGIDNIAVGDGAGDDQSGPAYNTSANQSIYLGASSMSLQSGDSNEIVIGAYAVGAGSNTVTLGNTNVATTVLRGQVQLTNGGAPASIRFADGTVQSTAASNGAAGTATTLNVTGSSGGLTVTGTNLGTGFSLSSLANSDKLLLGWNSGGMGEQDFIGNEGANSPGGFSFYDYSNQGVLTQLMYLAGPTATTRLTVNGSMQIAGTGASITFPDTTVQATAWNGTTVGGDYAEAVDVSGERANYEPGDVIEMNPASPGRFEKSSKPYSKLVAGVFSTKPGLVGRRTTAERPDKEAEVPMAMLGIAPVKVSDENGPIEPGDLLVSSSRRGYAMKGTDSSKLTGAVIGKALGALTSGSRLIEVLISLQ